MNLEAIATQHATRLTTADPLLPSTDTFDGTAFALATFHAGKGDSAASGVATRTAVAADSDYSLWRALVEHRLTLRLAGSQPDEALAQVLTQWDEYLAEVATPGDWDTAAVVPRPSRDTVGLAELLRHGFAPVRVLAARPADRLATPGPAAEPGVRIRPAEPADVSTAVELHTELLRYDAEFGVVTLRASAGDILTAEVERQVVRADPMLWIAELYGKPLGMLQIQLPPQSNWAKPYVRGERVGYLTSLHVSEAARSTGVGSALAAHAHQLFDEASVDVVLLHHALANPRSTPFWYSQGYRPLWTYWQRRPAVR